MRSAVQPPGVIGSEFLPYHGRRESRIAERNSQRVVEKLIYEREARAIAIVLGVGSQVCVGVLLTPQIHVHRPLAVLERADRLQSDRARQSLANEGRVRGLVHGDGIDELGGVLVVLDGAVVAGAHLLAAVQEAGGELRVGSADADIGGASVRAL